jgi:hypothetical protein
MTAVSEGTFVGRYATAEPMAVVNVRDGGPPKVPLDYLVPAPVPVWGPEPSRLGGEEAPTGVEPVYQVLQTCA